MSTAVMIGWIICGWILYILICNISKYIERIAQSNNQIVELLDSLNQKIELIETQTSEIQTYAILKMPPPRRLDYDEGN